MLIRTPTYRQNNSLSTQQVKNFSNEDMQLESHEVLRCPYLLLPDSATAPLDTLFPDVTYYLLQVK